MAQGARMRMWGVGGGGCGSSGHCSTRGNGEKKKEVLRLTLKRLIMARPFPSVSDKQSTADFHQAW